MRVLSPKPLLDLHQFARWRRGGLRFQGLFAAPVVHHRDLLHARDGAPRRAGFAREVFAPDIFLGVAGERHTGLAALLRTPVHQAIFANVKVARAGAATPLIRFTLRDVVLEFIEARKRALAERHNLFEKLSVARAKRTKLAVPIVNDAHRTRETQS